MFFKLIFLIGQKLRNPSLDNIYHFLKKSEYWSIAELEQYQLEQLKALLKFSNLNSPYYKQKFENRNFKITDVKSLADIIKIPILEKDDLYLYKDEIQSTFKFKDLKKATTSGTSGDSLQFFRDEYADSFNRASILRGYSWHNVKIWEKNGYFWGLNFSFFSKIKTSFLDYLQHRFRLFSFKENEKMAFVRKLKNTRYLHGYSSMIYEIAKYINKENLPKPSKLKMVKGTSEKILDAYQKEVKEAFGLKIISEYGATESGIIAFECLKGNMHLNMESCIVEAIENEIVVTNLTMTSFPIIRYKLGDYIKLSNKECECGMKHKVLEEVTGRVGSLIYGQKETYPSLTFYYVFKNLDKLNLSLNYYIVQNKKGSIEVYIEQLLTQNDHKILTNEFVKYFKEDLNIILTDNYTSEQMNKKKVSFVSNI